MLAHNYLLLTVLIFNLLTLLQHLLVETNKLKTNFTQSMYLHNFKTHYPNYITPITTFIYFRRISTNQEKEERRARVKHIL